MERIEAILWLREYLEDNILMNVKPRMPLFDSATTPFMENIFLEGLVNEIIKQIDETPSVDPLTIVGNLHYMFDEVLAESDDDHFLTHRFAAYNERAANDIYWYLKKKEDMRNGFLGKHERRL